MALQVAQGHLHQDVVDMKAHQFVGAVQNAMQPKPLMLNNGCQKN